MHHNRRLSLFSQLVQDIENGPLGGGIDAGERLIHEVKVRFLDQRDPFDPPSPGDMIWNPLYDPRGERYALLVGGFSGQYAEDQLKNLLAGMGVTVQKRLDKSTDFLIVGNEQYVDQDGQPVETPIQPTDLPVFKEATAQGVQVVLLRDLRNYFRF
jgi:hypothetical protein